jgi:hypothetical protein
MKGVPRLLSCFLVIGSTSLGLVAVFPGSVSPAGAATCGTSNLYLDGTNTTSTNAYYAQSDITTRVPAVCGSSATEDAAWVMIMGSNKNGFAQVGYYETNNSNNDLLVAAEQETSVNNYVEKDFNVYAPSGSPQYSVLYNFNGGYMIMSADNSNYIWDGTFDPLSYWTSPWEPRWEGETHYSGDNVPGTASAPAYFSSMLITTTRGGGAVTPTGLTLGTNNSRYSYAWDTTDSKFHIWTNS